ncbi:DUF5692 family protein [Magnetofaba australis]|uniref:Uncharacterized protein n=1 Tax=Magnetofaba australis IT-1 TaxID=1434232 RepID=A0A1Y2K053_9PROT|nr:DUF5692 family protein [Magnetofaba australis]OSM01408.1 hypothetical protein MAIT1_01354 [Magnetofaba australis IT-1]
MLIAWIAICAAILVGVAIFLNRLQGWWGHVAVFIGIPALLLAYWMQPGSNVAAGTFGYLKFVSVCIGGALISGLRFRNWADKHGWRLVAYLVLFINILEAVGFEILDVMISTPEQSFGGSLLNAGAGALLLLTQAYPRFITVNRDDARNPLEYDLGVGWVLAYVVWNFTFVYGTIPPETQPGQWAAFAIVHLLPPLLLMGGNGARFIQARTYTLPFAMALYITNPGAPWLPVAENWHSPQIALALGAVALLMTVATAVMMWRGRPAGEAPRTLLESLLGKLVKG